MATASVTTKTGDGKEMPRPLGPDLYYEAKAWFVRHRTTLHGFLTPEGFSVREARDALTGANMSARARELRKLISKKTGIPIAEEKPAT